MLHPSSLKGTKSDLQAQKCHASIKACQKFITLLSRSFALFTGGILSLPVPGEGTDHLRSRCCRVSTQSFAVFCCKPAVEEPPPHRATMSAAALQLTSISHPCLTPLPRQDMGVFLSGTTGSLCHIVPYTPPNLVPPALQLAFLCQE